MDRAPTNAPTFQVSAGFNARYRDGNWVPFQISLSNGGADFAGSISINAPSPYAGQGNPNLLPSPAYKAAITLANSAQKQITMYIPINLNAPGFTQQINIDLLDSNGSRVSRQSSTISALGQNDIFVGTLSDQNTGFNALYSVPLPNQGGTMIVETLNASTLPPSAAVLKNFDLIVLDNFTSSTLSNDQLTALQTWVNQGGALIEAGGPEWRRTLSTLPASLLPVTINGSGTLPRGTRLLPFGSAIQQASTGAIDAPVTVSIGHSLVSSGGVNGSATSTILASGGIPLIVQEREGQGIICYLAFDPTLEPVASWSGANTLWKGLVQRTLGDKLLNSNNGFVQVNPLQTGGLGGLLQNLLSNAFPSPWLLLLLVLGYLVMLGPVRLLIVRWSKRRDWSWRIVLSSIVVFSLLTYGLAIQQKGASILSNSVSIIQLNQGASSAHVTTYVGVFVLNQGDYQVHIPGNGLVQPSTDQNFASQSPDSAPLTTISPGQNGTDVKLQGVTFSTTRSLIADRDRAIQGGIDSQLRLRNGVLSGTVTNTLSYGLSDVYVLMSNSFARVGHLSAGQSAQVRLVLNSSSNNAGMQGQSLADQLAASNSLPTPFNGSPPQNELERHMAILAALSGEGGYSYVTCGGGICKSASYQGVVSSSGTTVFLKRGGGPITFNVNDPLLVAGSPATLIGWADTPADTTSNVTVNGTSPSGLQETLVQSPLNIDFSGTLNLPSNFMAGQLVDVQGSSIQAQYPGAYTMTTGSMTFEFAVSIDSNMQVSNLRVSEPANLAQIGGPPSTSGGSVVDASHLQAYLFNWQTKAWDTITLSGFTFSTPDTKAYINADGRVLLRLANQDSSVGTIFFGKPLLSLQ
ncbi:MAG: hypothetical protein NVSMB27_31760 [Ktedonobacteraceae bacterium]